MDGQHRCPTMTFLFQPSATTPVIVLLLHRPHPRCPTLPLHRRVCRRRRWCSGFSFLHHHHRGHDDGQRCLRREDPVSARVVMSYGRRKGRPALVNSQLLRLSPSLSRDLGDGGGGRGTWLSAEYRFQAVTPQLCGFPVLTSCHVLNAISRLPGRR